MRLGTNLAGLKLLDDTDAVVVVVDGVGVDAIGVAIAVAIAVATPSFACHYASTTATSTPSSFHSHHFNKTTSPFIISYLSYQ